MIIKIVSCFTTRCLFSVFLIAIYSLNIIAQNGEQTVNTLIDMGFENVTWTENNHERTYVVENTAYRLSGVGISRAIEQIQSTGMPTGKTCRLIVTDNNIPQISVYHSPLNNDTTQQVSRRDWKVSYDLGEAWNELKKEKRKNSSLYKVDVVVYPEFSFKNVIITQLYQSVLSLSPAVEVSLWKGMKFSGQLIIPIYNDGYPSQMSKVRPGFITLSQSIRLPKNIFATATIGTFNQERYGAELKLFHPLFFDNHFSIEGRVGYTQSGVWDEKFKFGYTKGDNKVTWSLGGNYYWERFNTQLNGRVEQYLEGEVGLRAEMIRHFRYTSIGFYAAKASKGADFLYGFRFQVALPPYRYKRTKHIPRVIPSKNMGINYVASNEERYYRAFRAQASDNIMQQNNFNPYFIKSELINF